MKCHTAACSQPAVAMIGWRAAKGRPDAGPDAPACAVHARTHHGWSMVVTPLVNQPARVIDWQFGPAWVERCYTS